MILEAAHLAHGGYSAFSPRQVLGIRADQPIGQLLGESGLADQRMREQRPLDPMRVSVWCLGGNPWF